MQTVVEVAYKIDSSLVPPSKETINNLVQQTLDLSIVSDECHKNILLDLVSNHIQIKSFLEVWNGHACQVFLKPFELVKYNFKLSLCLNFSCTIYIS